MKKRSIFLILVLFTILITGCKYNFILPEEVTPPNPDGEPVKYSTQVQPIFTAKCIECHKPGGTAPDLTSGNSYNQVVPSHVNLTKPEESDVYVFPSPTTAVHTWKKYSANEANLVLTWIKEGAKNN
jgi:hypothetical protein